MSTRNDSDKIDDELVCVDSFVQRLKEIDSDQMITVCRECNDPPDFWVTIAGSQYAVEVTSIVVDQHYHALCKKLKESIQAALKASNSIQGTYALDVRRRPELPRRGTTLWSQLITEAIQTLQTMSHAPTSTAMPLLKDKAGYVSLAKWAEDGQTIGLCSTSRGKWESEAREELTRLLQEATAKKRAKVQKAGIPQRGLDVVLLFYDAYGYGDGEDARQALAKVQGYEWFHSLFWVSSFSNRANTLYPNSPGRAGVFLYSKNGVWQ
jgi:hypothetical protein